MRLLLDVDWSGERLTGSLRRPDDRAGVAYSGVLDLVAALEHFLGPRPPDGGRRSGSGRRPGPTVSPGPG